MAANLQAVQEESKPAKAKTVYTPVKMSDGRTVEFAGTRQLQKEYFIDEKKMEVTLRFDFRNGETRSFIIPDSLLLQFAGHGGIQKVGDETAGEKKVEDMVIAVDSILGNLGQGKWKVREPGDSFSGASIVIKAMVEVTGKTVQEIKDYLQKKLDDAKARGEELTRAALYKALRNPKTKIGQAVARLEEEENSKNVAVNADDLAAELLGS